MLVCIADQQLRPVHLHGDLLQLREHRPADALPAKIARNHNVVDLHRLGRDPHREDRDQFADELPEQTTCRNCTILPFGAQEGLHGAGIGAFDGADEKALSFHRYGPLRLLL